METTGELKVVRRTRPKVRAAVDNISRVIPPTLPPAPQPSPETGSSSTDDMSALRARACLELSRYLTSKLTKVGNPSELDDLIEDLLEDDTLLKLTNRMRDLLSVRETFSAVSNGSQRSAPDYLVDLANSHVPLVEMIRFGYRVESACQVASWQYLAHYATIRGRSGAAAEDLETEKVDSRMWFLTDRDMPVEWREVFLADAKSDVAQDALFALAVSKASGKNDAPKGMVERLVKIWVDGARAMLTLLTTHPAVDAVDDTMIDRGKREGLIRAMEVEEHAELGYQARLAAARAAGDVYPAPSEDPDGE